MRDRKNVLQEKLDEFIRKYYINRLLQGLLIALGGLLAFFIAASVIEYFGHFGKAVRTFMFFSYILFAAVIMIVYIANPLLKWMRIGKVISYEKASELIGRHFPEISDRLLNTLQLQEQAKSSANELLLASIDQKINKLNPFRFSSAINLSSSAKKYAKYTVLPLLVLFSILVFQSSMITKPAERIIGFDRHFEKEAPFKFVLLNKDLKVLKNSDFIIDLQLQGKKIPSVIHLELDGHLIKMENTEKNRFSFSIPNLTANHEFRFTDGEYYSVPYMLEVLPNPTLVNFKVNLIYPSYIGRQNESLNNTGDFTIPEGTTVEWLFTTKDVEDLNFAFGNTPAKVERQGDVFKVKAKVMLGVNYHLQLKNKFIGNKDTIHYGIQTIADRYPGIAAEQTKDSINPFQMYFYGKADDDYGISRLNFAYKNLSSGSAVKYLPVNIGKTTDEIFYYMVNLKDLVKNDGDELEYYFEVWDNDGVNGKKSSKSQVFKIQAPSEKDLRNESESGNSAMKNKMAQVMKELDNMQKKATDLKREMTENEQMDWNQQQKLKDFISEQKKLEQKLEEIKKDNKVLNEKQNQLDPLDEELLKKQKELEKLMNQVMTPEMKEMLKKLEELVKQQNKDAIQDQLDKMKLGNEDIKKELDRSLEQFKQLELEKKINEQTDALNKLSKEQEELANKTLEKSESKESLMKQQEDLNKKFDELKKEIQETEEKNKELETPLNLDDTKQDQESIDKSMDESSESLSKKQNSKAGKSQKDAAEKMDQMAAKMKKSLEKAQEEQEEEDYFTLRQILENLIELSVQQEDLMKQMKENRYYSPKYVELSARQQKLKESAKMVEDSLLSLSKRQIHIQSFVNKEIGNINNYMKQALEDFGNVSISRGVSNQQYVMTGLNNLALMLSESLKQMQESMNEKKNSKSQCKKPGNKPGKKGSGQGDGKPKNMKSMKQMQDELSKQLQNMKDNKQQGKSPGSEQFAKIAAQQEAIRRAIESLQKKLQEEGKTDALGDLEKTKQLMEQQERDLVNKMITPETMRRMKEIETRMLEHEKAEMEQDMDNEREAEKAEEIQKEMPPALKEYLEKKAREMELLRSVPNELSPYYKDRVRVYFQKLGNG